MKRFSIFRLVFSLAALVSAPALWSCNGDIVDSEGKMHGVRFEIIYDSDGGSPVETQQYDSPGKITKPEDPVKSGYAFMGWQSDYSGSYKPFDFDKTTIFPYRTSYTFKAVWLATYRVLLKAGDGYFLDEDQQQLTEYEILVARNYPMEFPGITPVSNTEGKEFFKWYMDEETTSGNLFDFEGIIDRDTVLYARYVVPGTIFSVTFDSRGGTAVGKQSDVEVCPEPDAPTKVVDYGGSVGQLTRTFRFWIDEEGKEYDFDQPLKRDMTLYAVWSPLPDDAYTIDVNTTNTDVVTIKSINAPYAAIEEHYDLPATVSVSGTPRTIVGFFDARPSENPNNPGNLLANPVLTTKGVFTQNTVVKSIYMPPTYTRLGQWTFGLATNLKNVFFYGLTESTPHVGNWNAITWAGSPTLAHQPFARSGLEVAHIPSTVTSITARHFYFGCVSLHTVHFHGTDPIEISDTYNMLSGCAALRTVIIEKHVPPTISTTIAGIFNTATEIWVPKGYLETYQTAPNWSNWAGVMKELDY